MAPEIYGETRGLSYVMRQPESPDEKRRALQALVACPTASIGGGKGAEVREALATFPQRIHGPVHDCGLRAESSFGATSYLVLRGGGNVLIASPRAGGPRRLLVLLGRASAFVGEAPRPSVPLGPAGARPPTRGRLRRRDAGEDPPAARPAARLTCVAQRPFPVGARLFPRCEFQRRAVA